MEEIEVKNEFNGLNRFDSEQFLVFDKGWFSNYFLCRIEI